MQDMELSGKRVLIREDLNVPIREGKIASAQRIDAAIPTIKAALDAGASVLVMSHLGRPVEGEYEPDFSLAPVAEYLQSVLGQPVPVIRDYLEAVPAIAPGTLALMENVRFNRGEKSDDEALAKRYALLCDVFVMDAFGTAHRAQASTHGVGEYAKVACAGPLLTAELDALERSLTVPESPTIAIVGGSKVSTKLTVLEAICEKVDSLLPGGGIANTFIAAMGYPVGRSLHEPELVGIAKSLITSMEANGKQILLPTDVVVGTALDPSTTSAIKALDQLSGEDMILDIGPDTRGHYASALERAATIIWNGPVGVFEFEKFSAGTRALTEAIARSPAFSIAGGGDTLAAIEKFDAGADISYISTGGGAFLEFIEGKKLPAVAMLERSALRTVQ